MWTVGIASVEGEMWSVISCAVLRSVHVGCNGPRRWPRQLTDGSTLLISVPFLSRIHSRIHAFVHVDNADVF